MTGRFGRRVQYWGQRFVGEGHCHLLATDAHHPQRRPPMLAEARDAAALLVGREAAEDMVVTRPAGVLANDDPELLPSLAAKVPGFRPADPSRWASGSSLNRFLRGLRGTA